MDKMGTFEIGLNKAIENANSAVDRFTAKFGDDPHYALTSADDAFRAVATRTAALATQAAIAHFTSQGLGGGELEVQIGNYLRENVVRNAVSAANFSGTSRNMLEREVLRANAELLRTFEAM